MGKISVTQFLSLDGVMETPEKWHFPYLTEDFQADVNADILASDAMMMGKNTFVGFAGLWSTQTNEQFPFADKLNNGLKFVVSSSLEKAEWNNSRIIRDITTEVPKIKQEISGKIGVTGSAQLVWSLMKADLIDEYWLTVHPIVVGSGIRLFPEGINTSKLQLTESKTYSSGVVGLRYQVAR